MAHRGIENTLRTLLRSANPVAIDLLLVALDSQESALRVGAVRALALRSDRAGHRALVERLHRLPPDALSALRDLAKDGPLTDSLIAMVRADTPRLARRAIELAADWGAIDVLPTAAEAAQWPTEFADAIAADVLRLAEVLERALREYDPAAAAQAEVSPIDPSFARRAAVNALTKALRPESQEPSPALLQALLMLTPADEPAIWAALADDSIPAHRPLVKALQISHCHGALGILAHALVDPRSPRSVLDLATARADRKGMETMLGHLKYPLGARVRESCRRIEGFAWLEPHRVGVLSLLDGHAQAVAVALAAASATPPRRLVEAVLVVLGSEAPQARLAACHAIEALPAHLAVEPLGAVLKGDDAAAIASAALLLRRKDYPNATGSLVGLLDHADERVRAAAQRGLRELSFAMFREKLGEMTPDQQSRAGRLVYKADPFAAATFRGELGSGAASRRLEALRVIELMGCADDLSEPLAGALADNDAGVRAESARLLSGVEPTPTVVEALRLCLEDRSRAVRSAAEASLAALGVATRYEPEGVS